MSTLTRRSCSRKSKGVDPLTKQAAGVPRRRDARWQKRETRAGQKFKHWPHRQHKHETQEGGAELSSLSVAPGELQRGGFIDGHGWWHSELDGSALNVEEREAKEGRMGPRAHRGTDAQLSADRYPLTRTRSMQRLPWWRTVTKRRPTQITTRPFPCYKAGKAVELKRR